MNVHHLPQAVHGESVARVIAIGNFDGLHLGHRSLTAAATSIAARLNLVPTLLTFDPHPMKILLKGKDFRQIWPRSELVRRLPDFGIEELFLQKFDEVFSQKTASDFIADVLMPLNPKVIVVGFDFQFGRNRSGNAELLQQSLKPMSVAVEIIPELKKLGVKVASGQIKALLQSGKLDAATDQLGEPYYIRGEVVSGEKRGHQIGFPTANLQTDWELNLGLGVYKTRARVGGESHRSITNVGRNPTFGSGESIKIETHIFDFDRDLYGQSIAIQFLEFLRPEKKFASKNELVAQIKKDIERARG